MIRRYRRSGDVDPPGIEQAHQGGGDPVGGLLGIGQLRHGCLEKISQVNVCGEHLCIIFRQLIFGDEPVFFLIRQFRHLVRHLLDPAAVHKEGHQVRIRKVSVIMGLFLAPHGNGSVFFRIPQPGFLDHGISFFQDEGLPVYFVLNGFFHMPEGVQVLEFRAGTECGLSAGPQGNIGITPETALFHVAVAYIDISEDGVQFPQIGPGLGRGPDIGLTDDLDQGNAGAVQVHQAFAPDRIMDQFAGILLHMNPGDPDGFFPGVFCFDVQVSVFSYGSGILGDLVSFGQVRVKIVFPVEPALFGNGAAGGQGRFDGKGHGLFV